MQQPHTRLPWHSVSGAHHPDGGAMHSPGTPIEELNQTLDPLTGDCGDGGGWESHWIDLGGEG
jgi:hypothetical protein